MFGPLLEVQMSKKCTLLWREAHFQVKSVKNWRVQNTFGSFDAEKVYDVVARSTCPSQNVQSTCSDHFCTPLWREAYSKSKRHMCGPLLTVEMWFCVAGARDCEPCQKWAKHEGFATLHCITYNYPPLHHTTPHSTLITPHYTTLQYTIHYTTLHYTTLRHTTLLCAALHFTTLPSTPLRYTTLNHTTLHSSTIHYTTPDYTLHYTPPHYTPLHYIILHSTALRYTTPTTTSITTLLYTTLHYIGPPNITLHRSHYTSTI